MFNVIVLADQGAGGKKNTTEYIIDIRKSISQLAKLFSSFLSICSYLPLPVDFQGQCWYLSFDEVTLF